MSETVVQAIPLSRITVLERVIERGKQTFIEVGQALAEIQERRLYRQQDYPTFEAYCKERWGWTRRIAYTYIEAADVAENVLSAAHSAPSLTQAAALAPLEPDQQREVAASIDFATATVADVRQAVRALSSHQLIQASTNNEWYTPARYVDAARELMGGIDVDPASNPMANETIRATTYYTQETDGLAHDWHGRVWLNPPYGFAEGGKSNQEIWSARLIAQYWAGITHEAVLLVNAVTDRTWFAPLWDFPICFTDHRIRFYNQDTEAGQPTHGNVLVYLGPEVARFTAVFSAFGHIVVPWRMEPVCESGALLTAGQIAAPALIGRTLARPLTWRKGTQT
jgi:hypothetical protein